MNKTQVFILFEISLSFNLAKGAASMGSLVGIIRNQDILIKKILKVNYQLDGNVLTQYDNIPILSRLIQEQE